MNASEVIGLSPIFLAAGGLPSSIGFNRADKLLPLALVRHHESVVLNRLFVLILIPIKIYKRYTLKSNRGSRIEIRGRRGYVQA